MHHNNAFTFLLRLAATKMVKLDRRDVSSVNVARAW